MHTYKFSGTNKMYISVYIKLKACFYIKKPNTVLCYVV